jgi:hypothetical protein
LTPIGIIRRGNREPIGRPEQPVGERKMERAEGTERRRGEKENCDGVEAFLEAPTGENSNHESATVKNNST